MAQTSAEYLREEGMQTGKVRAAQDILMDLIKEKFGVVPTEAAQQIRILDDTEKLSRLLRQVIHASSIEEMGL